MKRSNLLQMEKGVVDAAIWVGYAWGDAPRNHAVVMTVGDNKKLC